MNHLIDGTIRNDCTDLGSNLPSHEDLLLSEGLNSQGDDLCQSHSVLEAIASTLEAAPPELCGRLDIRAPQPNDLGQIIAVVRECEPFLTPHISYVYWMATRNWSRSCAVAELSGKVVGWCSMFPVSAGKFFLHQVAVTRNVRRMGVAESLVMYLVEKLRQEDIARLEIELTIDRANTAGLQLLRAVADRAEMHWEKQRDVVTLLEAGCNEELYLMSA